MILNERGKMQISEILSKEYDNKKVVIVCAGENGQVVAEILQKKQVKVLCYADNDIDKQGKAIKGVKVYAVAKATEQYDDAMYIITNIAHACDLYKQLINLGVSDSNIVTLDVYDLIELKESCSALWKTEDKYFIYNDPIRNGRCYYQSKIEFYAGQVKHMCQSKMVKKRITNYGVSICAIFKNEARYMKEWLDFHILVGVEHFYLYNNNSTDGYMEILQPYIEKKLVTYVEWPYKQGQISAYLHCIDNFKTESRWIGFIDLDEFVTPITHSNVCDFLKYYENHGSVWVPWKIFGSSGLDKRDEKRMVTADFTLCWPKPATVGKCFYNTLFDICQDEHKTKMMHHFLYTKVEGKNVPPVNVYGQLCVPPLFGGKSIQLPMQINHYVVKSRAEYQRKIEGSDVFFKVNSHTDKAFVFHDRKCVSEDFSIQRFVKLLEKSSQQL